MSDIDRILYTLDARIKVMNKHLDRLGDQLETIIDLQIRAHPAPTPVIASGEARDRTHAMPPDDPGTEQGNPVLADVRGRSEGCDHDWTQYELKAEAECTKCGLPYNEWSLE